jgi:hypothetical protein
VRRVLSTWLLLAHQLPTRGSNARVKTWRRLQQVGALPARNSVYVLPNTDQCREDFEWLRTEILALGGEATVFVAEPLSPDGDDAIVRGFREARAADYRTLEAEAKRARPAAGGRQPTSPASRERLVRAIRVLRDRLAAIQRIDFCQADGQAEAEHAIEKLEGQAMAHAQTQRQRQPTPAEGREVFARRRWVTRPRPGVDRMSSAWLIRTFIDPYATFAFVSRPEGADVAFDMYEGQFGHQGSSCTFEVLAERFKIGAAAVRRIGQIVHDLDMKEARYELPETATIGHLVEGLRRKHADDHALLEHGIAMFDALARSFGYDGRGVIHHDEETRPLPRRRDSRRRGGRRRATDAKRPRHRRD